MCSDFRYLAQIDFESPEGKEDIRKRGLQAKIPKEASGLGVRFRKEIESAKVLSMSVHFLGDEVGFGCFAEEDIPADAFVGEYTGVVRRNDIRRYSLNNYLYKYPVEDINGIHFVIDGTAGNTTRFINHSFQPNLDPVYAFFDGFYHLIFVSLQPIQKGEQLFYNYGTGYWGLRKYPQELERYYK